MQQTESPRVSIVMSTYKRGFLLRYAVQSVLDQTFQDWELFIVDDASPDNTGDIAREFDDSRIRYFRLDRNFGEQSGPNNLGVQNARGEWIAFLNNDDLWFPEHLEISLRCAESRKADGVLAGNVAPQPCTHGKTDFDTTAVSLRGVGLNHQWRPEVYTPASSWLIRKTLHESLKGWRPAAKCGFESSQDFLFRAHRAGARLFLSQKITVLIVQSSNRLGSYLDQSSPEHEFWFRSMREDLEFRAKLFERAAYVQARIAFKTRFAPGLRQVLCCVVSPFAYRILPRLGFHPRALKYCWKFRGRGGFIRSLKQRRGNPESM